MSPLDFDPIPPNKVHFALIMSCQTCSFRINLHDLELQRLQNRNISNLIWKKSPVIRIKEWYLFLLFLLLKKPDTCITEMQVAFFRIHIHFHEGVFINLAHKPRLEVFNLPEHLCIKPRSCLILTTPRVEIFPISFNSIPFMPMKARDINNSISA